MSEKTFQLSDRPARSGRPIRYPTEEMVLSGIVPKEAPVQKDLIKLARLEFRFKLFRNNSRVFNVPGVGGVDRLMRAGLGKGSADLVGCLPPWGTFFAVEVKRPSKPGRYVDIPDEDQMAWLTNIRATGGVGCWASSVPMLRRIMARLIQPDGWRYTILVEPNGTQRLVEKEGIGG